MKTMNLEQVAFLNQIIHTLHTSEEEPIETFFSGPAGAGKTYTLTLR
jgi:pantothenate kinase-related protein Tda10